MPKRDGGFDDWFVPARPPGDADGLDDWFVPASDGNPDDWFVPAPAAPATAQPALSPPAGTADPALTTRPAPRPDPLAAFSSLIPASKWVTPPPIFPDAFGRFPLPPAPLPSAPRLDAGYGLFGGQANLLAASSPPTYGLFGVLKNPPLGNSAAFPPFQGAGPASGNGDQSGATSFVQTPANVDSRPRTDQTRLALDQTPAATTTPFSEPDTGLAQPISCQGPTCSEGGSFGTTGMYIVSGRTLCRDCAVKFLGIQDLPATEQTKILRNFLR
jgi:hypothetical protein